MGWLSGFTYRKQITLNSDSYSSATVNDYTVAIHIHDEDVYVQSLSGGGYDATDVRFTASDGSTELGFDRVDKWADEGYFGHTFFIKVPTYLGSGDTTIYMYYRKSGVSFPARSSGYDSYTVAVYQFGWDSGLSVKDSITGGDGTSNGVYADYDIYGQIASWLGGYLYPPDDKLTFYWTSRLGSAVSGFTLTMLLKPYTVSSALQELFWIDDTETVKLNLEYNTINVIAGGVNAACGNLTVNETILLTLVVDYANDYVKVYIDGSLAMNQTVNFSSSTGYMPGGIGSGEDGFNFDGQIDYIRLDDTIRNSDWCSKYEAFRFVLNYTSGAQTTEPTAEVPTVSTTTPATSIGYTGATCAGNVSSDGGATVTEKGICYSTSSTPTTANSKVTDGSGTGGISAALTGLSRNTTYYFRAYAINSVGTAYGSEVSFTLADSLPYCTLVSAYKTGYTTAFAQIEITSIGDPGATMAGIVMNTTGSPTLGPDYSYAYTSGISLGTRDCYLSESNANLSANTTYYIRGFVYNSFGTTYTTQQSFTTDAYSIPIVNTDPTVWDVTGTIPGGTTANFCRAYGNITDEKGQTVTTKGIVFSTSDSNPIVGGSNCFTSAYGSGGTGYFGVDLSSLTPNTTYYFKAYGYNSQGYGYGSTYSFTTKTAVGPTLDATTSVSSISYTVAASGGNITDFGGDYVTARGICWSTSQNPTTANNKTSDGSGTGSFSSSLTGLSANTLYYVRSYSTNIYGTSYGTQVSFSTLAYAIPTLSTTTPATSILYTSATCAGNVSADNGQSVTEKGICYSASPNPTTSNSKITSGTGTGAISSNLTGLNAGTLYYFRAYAINSVGTAYGSEVSFTTSPYTAPTVTTTSIVKASVNSVTAAGNVSSDGGQTVTERGICFSKTNATPTTSDTKDTNGTGTGSYSENIPGIETTVLYYYRAYATNSIGTSYGSVISFTITRPLKIQGWAGGGAGGGMNMSSDGGGGGGGGAFSELSAYLAAAGSYTVSIGAGGTGVASSKGGDGGDSYFKDTSTLLAKGGTGGSPSTGTPPSGGAGGVTTTGVGDIKYAGGRGEKGRDDPAGQGGYGGSSAGSAANGFSGPTTWSTVTYPTGSTPVGAGYGGNGSTQNNNGNAPASGYGGGGGGAGEGTARVGGNAAGGKVIIRYLTSDYTGWTITGGTITAEGNDTVHTFSSTGTFTIAAPSTGFKMYVGSVQVSKFYLGSTEIVTAFIGASSLKV